MWVGEKYFVLSIDCIRWLWRKWFNIDIQQVGDGYVKMRSLSSSRYHIISDLSITGITCEENWQIATPGSISKALGYVRLISSTDYFSPSWPTMQDTRTRMVRTAFSVCWEREGKNAAKSPTFTHHHRSLFRKLCVSSFKTWPLRINLMFGIALCWVG